MTAACCHAASERSPSSVIGSVVFGMFIGPGGGGVSADATADMRSSRSAKPLQRFMKPPAYERLRRKRREVAGKVRLRGSSVARLRGYAVARPVLPRNRATA